MSGGMATGTARVRIKGKRGSVVRFLILSISYTLPWIIMLSQLAYYSKVYGPQVLLQLNIAYYLPSIPTLLLFGQVEKLLDAEFGRTASMAIRLMAGLAACAALAAYYPFMPTHLAYLLGLVVVLGAVSSVAFSTSYQLVAWFRSADTIALGIGCVASGPLALIIQIALQIGTKPTHWQWIALFEISAAMVVVGMLASASLMWQYWGIMSGREHYDDGTRQPLLDSDMQEQRIEEEADQQAMMLSRMLTLQDPFQGFPFTTTPGMVMQHPSFTLRRAASDDITDRRRHARSDRVAAAAEAGTAGLKPSAASAAAAVAAAAAAAAAGRQYKHSQTYALGRASAPLHAAGNSLYDGALNPAAAAAAAAVGPDVAGSSSSHSSGFLAAAAAAANARAASLHQYSGLPMVQPPGGNSAAAAAPGAWLPDFEQHISTAAAGGNSSSIGTPQGLSQLGTPTLRDPALWHAAASSGVSGASASANDSPRSSSRAASPGPSSAAASSRLGPPGSVALPAPAFTAAGSYLGELPQFAQQQQQKPLLTSVLGGSAPVFPLSASLLGEDSSCDPASPRGEDDSDDCSDESSLHNPGQQRMITSHRDEAGSPVSPSRLQQAIQQHAASQQQQQVLQQHAAAEVQPGGSAFQQQQQEVTLTVAPAGAVAKMAGHQRTASTASAAATSVTAPGESVLGEDEGKEAAESLADVFVEVLQGTWMVVLAALISSTIINCIFPFFTYVESSGLLGEFLPQVLFYTRMLSDIVGRLLPRRKALAITNPATLLALAGGLLVASGAFFGYLQVPPRMQHDPYVLVLILVLWLVGGYINTMSYILAPSLVAPRVCTKASAVMALTYQIAHILGLVIATGLAIALYGDIAGEL